VIEANAIVATTAGSERGNSNCGHRAADTRPPLQAGKITGIASQIASQSYRERQGQPDFARKAALRRSVILQTQYLARRSQLLLFA
jgi:hypothetical protein